MQTDHIIHDSPSAKHVMVISLLHHLDDYLAVRDYLEATSRRSAIWWAAETFPVWDSHVQLKHICHGGPELRASLQSVHGDALCNITSWDGIIINARASPYNRRSTEMVCWRPRLAAAGTAGTLKYESMFFSLKE